MIVVRTDIPRAYFAADAGVADIAEAQGQYRAWLKSSGASWTGMA